MYIHHYSDEKIKKFSENHNQVADIMLTIDKVNIVVD